MQMRKWFSVLAACSLAVSLTVTAPEPARAQDKLQQSPGGYHGELDFPISWKRFSAH